MKIKKITFNNHPYFPSNYIINFENVWNIPFITYLVWNNWAGKTLILKNITEVLWRISWPNINEWNYNVEYEIFLNDSDKENLSVIYDSCYLKHEKNWWNSNVRIIDGWWAQLSYSDFIDQTKLIYSTVEVNFKQEAIKTITSKIVDAKQPKEISTDLNKEIPQLLVDIKATDNDEIADWWRANPDKTMGEKPDNIWTRLDRFINAFNKIYCWSKVFEKIENKDLQKVIIFKDGNWKEVDISKFSSWEQQVLYRVWYLLKNLGTLSWWIILIDEPEISLHPIWQERFRDLLIEVFKDLDVQIIIATHSPYIFRKMDNNNEQTIKIDPKNNRNEKLIVKFPWTNYIPTPNYISYIAYDIVNVELHIELYEQLLIKYNKDKPSDLDDHLVTLWIAKDHSFQWDDWKAHNETLMTRIRNRIHHGNNTSRPDFSEDDLKQSIDIMISLLQQD